MAAPPFAAGTTSVSPTCRPRAPVPDFELPAADSAALVHAAGSWRRFPGGAWLPPCAGRFAGTVDAEVEDADAEDDDAARTDSDDATCALSASWMSLRRCSSPDSFFFGGVGCHGTVSASDASDSWLVGGGSELDEKSRLIERSPDIGCFGFFDIVRNKEEEQETGRVHSRRRRVAVRRWCSVGETAEDRKKSRLRAWSPETRCT